MHVRGLQGGGGQAHTYTCTQREREGGGRERERGPLCVIGIHIDHLMESHCLERRDIIEGGITQLLFCSHACENILFNCLSLHSLLCLFLSLSLSSFLSLSSSFCFPSLSLLIYTHTQMIGYIMNMGQMTACIDCPHSTIMFPLFTFQTLIYSRGVQ